MTMKKQLISAALAMALMSTGCSFFNSIISSNKEVQGEAAVTQYSTASLRNYKTARDFAAQGRYELAREHYLLALASASDPYLQDALAQELESVDMMIKSLR